MTEVQLTLMPPGGRRCGRRKKGGLYGCTGTDPNGAPVYSFLIDPAVPYVGEKFQGVQPADWLLALIAERTGFDASSIFLVQDMVGLEHYPTVPTYVEEIGRWGRSRRFQSTFDFDAVENKRLYAVDIHWRAIAEWADVIDHIDLPAVEFKHCRYVSPLDAEHLTEADLYHYPNCLYWLWPLVFEFEDLNEQQRVEGGGWSYNPLSVIKTQQVDTSEGGAPIYGWPFTLERLATQLLPQAAYKPGAFAIWPITHFEAVGFVPENATPEASGLPVVVVDE